MGRKNLLHPYFDTFSSIVLRGQPGPPSFTKEYYYKTNKQVIYLKNSKKRRMEFAY
jgi:hypothetical protein